MKIMPSKKPSVDDPCERKFKKNVDSTRRMTIIKGRKIPNSIRNKPRPRRKRGDLILVHTANRRRNDRARVQNPVVLFRHKSLRSFWHSADGNDIPWADLPNLAARREANLYRYPHCAHRGRRWPRAMPSCRDAAAFQGVRVYQPFQLDSLHT